MLSVRLYRRRLWEMFCLYRAVLVTMRIMEAIFVITRFLVFRAPLAIVWTRLPGLRGRKSPFPDLDPILTPARDRPPLLIHEVVTLPPGDCRTKEQLQEYMEGLRRRSSQPRSTVKTIGGGIIRGVFTEMGPAFLELAQIVSMRPELPPFAREELQSIQDAIPSIKPKDVRKIVGREMRRLGKTTEEVF